MGIKVFNADFYPRSPCGERPHKGAQYNHGEGYFYPRSPCGERLIPNSGTFRSTHNFYPRSPCGERLQTVTKWASSAKFLSTLSLRRATEKVPADVFYQAFLSTLSLRRATANWFDLWGWRDISIHALLAESDFFRHKKKPARL